MVPISTRDDLIVRDEKPDAGELSKIHSLHVAAFGHNNEADLIDGLRAEGVIIRSLVAELQGSVVGHVLFSRMMIDTTENSIPAAALAPISVLPKYQCQRIGECLVRRGLDISRDSGERIVIVLGHPDYYSRFGFSSQKAQFLESPFPPEAFMALELSHGALSGIRGKVRYPAAFGL